MKRFTYVCLVLATISCKKKDTAPAVAGSGSAPAATQPMPPPPPAADAAAPKPATPEPELATPESADYDATRDVYLVSNINGKPAEADGNGYITMIHPDDGKSEKWIAGGKDGAKLDAPKGMAIVGDTLYVADITVVRQFDAKTGKQKDDIKIPGSTFLNDISSDGKEGIFVSDTGMDASFKPTGTDAVWHIGKDGKATPLIKNKDLGGPNGVWPGDNGAVWVVTFRSGELYSVDAKGKKGKPEKLPKGQLDGIVAIGDGEFLVSSWEGKNVYRGKPGGEWKEVVTDVESPADIGFDPKRKKILIPQFTASKLVVKPL